MAGPFLDHPGVRALGCRRAVEYELRRLQRAIECAEVGIRQWTTSAATSNPDYPQQRRNAEERVDLHEAERVRCETRLRMLLDDLEAGGRSSGLDGRRGPA